MEFRTIVTPPHCENTIDHESRLMLLGSCFSDEIAGRLRDRFFKVCANPFGTLYNPASIKAALERIVHCHEFNSDEFFFHSNLYHSFHCHSSLSRTDKILMKETLDKKMHEASEWLKRSDFLFLTFGTAWVFEEKHSEMVVSNCHKLPADRFIHRMMDTDECAGHIQSCIALTKEAAPGCRICLTVSPIRHLANGAHGNQLSKSTLLLAADRVAKQEKDVGYFPSYEMLLDDLRDYRFYSADMCHPTQQASDYIFEQFENSYFTNDTKKLSDRCLKISHRLCHRPMTEDRSSYQNFLNKTESLIKSLITEHPSLSEAINKIR